MEITVASYNIHSCVGNDRSKSCNRIISVLKELKADVIALQEVSSGTGENILISFVDQFPEYHFYEGPTLLYERGQYGNAVLTKIKPESINLLDLSVEGREPRGAIELRLRYCGSSLRVIGTHLGLAPFERRHQTRKLLSSINAPKDQENTISVLMGDMNEWFIWGKPLRWLHNYFGYTPAIRTFPAKFPLLALDRIWVYPAHRTVWLRRHNSACAKQASDHLPLIARIDLTESR